VTVLATAPASNSAWDQPGTLGFLVVFGMAVILYFVFRSLSKHLRKINDAARLEAQQLAAQKSEAAADAGIGQPGLRPGEYAAGGGGPAVPDPGGVNSDAGRRQA
jgi:hypothetical protein